MKKSLIVSALGLMFFESFTAETGSYYIFSNPNLCSLSWTFLLRD